MHIKNIIMYKIANKLTMTFGLLIFSAIFVCGWYLYGQTKNHLEKELGQRLVDIAQAVATQLDGDIVTQLMPGNETGLTYQNLVSLLNKIKNRTAVSRIYIFDRQHCSLVDTETSVPIGTEYLKLKFDRMELENVWQEKGTSSVLFLGEDGNHYKSGYAPVSVKGETYAAVGVDASAAFLQILKRFRRNVLTFGLVCIFTSMIIVFIVSKTITNPIQNLVAAIEKISSGDLTTEIKISSSDEIGFLGRTMEQMRMNIIKRDAQMRLMLANVAHEIRNPLGGIELFADILAEELDPGEGQSGDSSPTGFARAHLEKITKEVRKLNQIITEFLDFARPKQPIKTEVDLKDLVQSAYFMLALEFEEANVGFEYQTEDVLKINVDTEQFKRVFINLFKNSLQAIKNSKISNGNVMIQARKKDREIEIILNDNGPGIPQENVTRLFEPFFTTKEKGAGLGLAIVQKIIADHGGSIEIQSKEGEYTTIIIKIFHPV